MTSSWIEYERSRSQPIKAQKPARPPKQPAEPVVVSRITYKPLTRYTITFEVQPDPKDVRIAVLEQLLEAAKMMGQGTSTLLLAAYQRIDELEALLAKDERKAEVQP